MLTSHRFYGIFFSVLMISFGGFAQQTGSHEEIHRLSKFYQIKQHESKTLQLKDKIAGHNLLFSLSIPSVTIEGQKSSTQIIDLTNIDTTLYAYLYSDAGTIPVSGILGYPLQIGDFDNNNQLDFLGVYDSIPDAINIFAGIAEMRPDTNFALQKVYSGLEIPLVPTDLNSDDIPEFNFKRDNYLDRFIPGSSNSFPDSLIGSYRLSDISGGIDQNERFCNLDNDSQGDLLYLATDTLPPNGLKVFVAEYDEALDTFIKRQRIVLNPLQTSPFAVGDFDQDNKPEFAVGSIYGEVFVVENTGNDSYEVSFTDTITASNAYLITNTNDIDQNGKQEFFIGGTTFVNGIGASRIYWFEANGDDSYQKVRDVALLGANVLGQYGLYAYDVNADMIDDLVFFYPYFALVLIWNSNGYFELFYYMNWFDLPDRIIQSVNVFDIFDEGTPALLIGYLDFLNQNPITRTRILRNNFITGIAAFEPLHLVPESIHISAYPNPFNGIVRVKFTLPNRSNLSIKIVNLLGKEVRTINKDQIYSSGDHELTWDGRDNHNIPVSSGIYLLSIHSKEITQSHKLIFIK